MESSVCSECSVCSVNNVQKVVHNVSPNDVHSVTVFSAPDRFGEETETARHLLLYRGHLLLDRGHLLLNMGQ